MYHQQITELETAIALLEKNPNFDVLSQVEACLTPPLWKVRVRQEPVSLTYGIPNALDPRWQEFRLNTFSNSPEHEYNYARACTYALHWINKEERRIVKRVLFMLKMWLKNERNLNPAPPAKAKKRRAASRPVAKQKTAWMGAKSFAKLADTVTLKNNKWKIDLKRCLLVTDSGVMATGDSVLLFVEGKVNKEPGVYNAKTGESVTEKTKHQQLYNEVLQRQRTPLATFTVNTQELWEGLKFCAVMGDIVTWEQGINGITLITKSFKGETFVTLTQDVQYLHTTAFNVKEAAKAVALMPGEVTVNLYPDGTLQFEGANAIAYCLTTKEN